ncbi:hypothetical protein Cus16_0681 [Curtobacterium sp. ER1/6]|nr:hypothetical protein Cus16_0681 [Curtobacterium sp. ER1/6]
MVLVGTTSVAEALRRRRRGGETGLLGARTTQLVELPLDVALELRTVVTLERAELVDLALELALLLLEHRDTLTVRVLGVGDDLALLGLGLVHETGGLRGALGDERVALLDALADVLLVETTGEREEVRGALGVLVGGDRRRGGSGGRDRRGLRSGGDGGRLGLGRRSGLLVVLRGGLRVGGLLDRGRLRRRLGGLQALPELVVLGRQATEFDDDLVQEVVDLVLVVAFPELRRLEPLVDYVFRRQSHCRHLDRTAERVEPLASRPNLPVTSSGADVRRGGHRSRPPYTGAGSEP